MTIKSRLCNSPLFRLNNHFESSCELLRKQFDIIYISGLKAQLFLWRFRVRSMFVDYIALSLKESLQVIPCSNRRPKPQRLTVKLWLKKSINQLKRPIYPLLPYYALSFWKSYGCWKRVKDRSRDLPCAYLNDFPFSRSRMNSSLMISGCLS